MLAVASSVLTATMVVPRLGGPPDVRSRQVEAGTDVRNADEAVELALIYLGSSDCPWSRVKEMRGILRGITRSVEAQAKAQGWAFRSIAVLQSPSSKVGLQFFDRMFFFDEVVLGGGSLNLGMRRYAIEDLIGPLATPQIILTARWRDTTEHRHIAVETVLMRKVGLRPIEDWAQRGAPVVLPPGSDANASASTPRQDKSGLKSDDP